MPNLLFSPLTLRGVTLGNRIVIAPMCQFSATDGCAGDWHLIHLGHLALSGAGMIVTEATAVEAEGRITRECLSLYTDEAEAALERVLSAVRRHSRIAVAVQLSHAGRKASTRAPWDGRGPVGSEEGGWSPIGPSARPWAEDALCPQEMTTDDMARVRGAFVQAARRCVRLGIDAIEMHAAHGYLLSSFLSPLANARTDAYGGSLQNRMRFPLEVFEALRAAWPANRPLGARINGTDWLEGGITPDEAVSFAAELRVRGCDFVDVSSGGNALAPIPSEPGYQVPFASRIRREAGLATMAVGLIRDPQQAEAILAAGDADLIALGRAMIHNPRWPWHAAEAFGVEIAHPRSYARGASSRGLPSPNSTRKD